MDGITIRFVRIHDWRGFTASFLEADHMKPSHDDRKWMKCLKRHLQLNKIARERGFERRLNPARLPK